MATQLPDHGSTWSPAARWLSQFPSSQRVSGLQVMVLLPMLPISRLVSLGAAVDVHKAVLAAELARLSP